MTIRSILSPAMAEAMEPRFGRLATTLTFSWAAIVPGSRAAQASAPSRPDISGRMICLMGASVFVGAVRADDRDPFEEELAVVVLAVEPESRLVVATGALVLEADLLELGRLVSDDGAPGLLARRLAVREAGQVIARAGAPAFGELTFEVAVTSFGRDDVRLESGAGRQDLHITAAPERLRLPEERPVDVQLHRLPLVGHVDPVDAGIELVARLEPRTGGAAGREIREKRLGGAGPSGRRRHSELQRAVGAGVKKPGQMLEPGQIAPIAVERGPFERSPDLGDGVDVLIPRVRYQHAQRQSVVRQALFAEEVGQSVRSVHREEGVIVQRVPLAEGALEASPLELQRPRERQGGDGS